MPVLPALMITIYKTLAQKQRDSSKQELPQDSVTVYCHTAPVITRLIKGTGLIARTEQGLESWAATW